MKTLKKQKRKSCPVYKSCLQSFTLLSLVKLRLFIEIIKRYLIKQGILFYVLSFCSSCETKYINSFCAFIIIPHISQHTSAQVIFTKISVKVKIY